MSLMSVQRLREIKRIELKGEENKIAICKKLQGQKMAYRHQQCLHMEATNYLV